MRQERLKRSPMAFARTLEGRATAIIERVQFIEHRVRSFGHALFFLSQRLTSRVADEPNFGSV